VGRFLLVLSVFVLCLDMSDKYLMVQDIMNKVIGENDCAYIEHVNPEINERMRLDVMMSKYVPLLQENPLEDVKESITRKLNTIIDQQKELNQAFALRLWTKKMAEEELRYVTDFYKDFEDFEIINDTVRICIESVVKETSHRIYFLWKEYYEDELFRSEHMKDSESCLSYSFSNELPWQTIIKTRAREMKTQMVETLKAMGIKMSTMTKDQIITSSEYKKLFPVKLIKRVENKIKLQASGKRKKTDSP